MAPVMSYFKPGSIYVRLTLLLELLEHIITPSDITNKRKILLRIHTYQYRLQVDQVDPNDEQLTLVVVDKLNTAAGIFVCPPRCGET